MLRCKRILESRVRLACLASALWGLAWLSEATAYGVISVNQPWVKPGTHSSEAYMVVTSSEGAALIAARSPLAGRVELVRASRRVTALALPAGTPVRFGPKGNRLALSGLAHPFKLGARIPLTLIIETAGGKRQEIEVDAEVRRESPAEAELRAHRH